MIEPNIRVFRGTAKVRKRCPQCGQMVEVGTPAVFRSFTPSRYGWQRGGFLGESAKARRTHAYHEACAKNAQEILCETT